MCLASPEWIQQAEVHRVAGRPAGVVARRQDQCCSRWPQVAGMRYLHSILGPIINRVFEEKKYVELDPSKVEVKDVG